MQSGQYNENMKYRKVTTDVKFSENIGNILCWWKIVNPSKGSFESF